MYEDVGVEFISKIIKIYLVITTTDWYNVITDRFS